MMRDLAAAMLFFIAFEAFFHMLLLFYDIFSHFASAIAREVFLYAIISILRHFHAAAIR